MKVWLGTFVGALLVCATGVGEYPYGVGQRYKSRTSTYQNTKQFFPNRPNVTGSPYHSGIKPTGTAGRHASHRTYTPQAKPFSNLRAPNPGYPAPNYYAGNGPTYRRYPLYAHPNTATFRQVASSRPGSRAYSNGLYTYPLSDRTFFAQNGNRASVVQRFDTSAGTIYQSDRGEVYRTASGYLIPLR